MKIEELTKLITEVKNKCPLVHHMTNEVTVNDCANVTLAIGGSPVMTTCINEVEEMVKMADSLVVNLGTINDSLYESIIKAGMAANEKGIPVVFDPVGVGATSYRTRIAQELLKTIKVSVIRGNASEIYALIGGKATTKGVDRGNVHLKNSEISLLAAKELGTVVVVSGKKDAVSSGSDLVEIDNGDIMLTKITGTGCMSSSLIGCFAGSTKNIFAAAITGTAIMGLAGERASKSIKQGEGLGTFHIRLIDEISNMNEQIFEEGVRLS